MRPGERLLVVDFIGAMPIAGGLRLGVGQPAPAAAEPLEQGIEAQPGCLDHALAGAAGGFGGNRGVVRALFKDGGAAKVPAGAAQTRGGRKKGFQESKHGSAPHLLVLLRETRTTLPVAAARRQQRTAAFPGKCREAAADGRAKAPEQCCRCPDRVYGAPGAENGREAGFGTGTGRRCSQDAGGAGDSRLRVPYGPGCLSGQSARSE